MTRLDAELVERQLAPSRSNAARLVAAGRVRVNGRLVSKGATPVRATDIIVAKPDPYVSRAGHKLADALDDLQFAVAGRALDAGASTGGFTQVLRQRGCAPVFAIDVGRGQLSQRLKADPHVVSRERTNLRDLELDHVGGRPVDLVVADVSFISLTLLVEPFSRVVEPGGHALLMVKPQFEVGRERLGKGGVVRDPDLQRQAVADVAAAAARQGWRPVAEVPSRLPGAGGNAEFFVLLARD
jgi:23S rRNA (cytidine1920-2'-O)/16S rRNA (cytidine1409-2'-O)-methyltransferase